MPDCRLCPVNAGAGQNVDKVSTIRQVSNNARGRALKTSPNVCSRKPLDDNSKCNTFKYSPRHPNVLQDSSFATLLTCLHTFRGGDTSSQFSHLQANSSFLSVRVSTRTYIHAEEPRRRSQYPWCAASNHGCKQHDYPCPLDPYCGDRQSPNRHETYSHLGIFT